MVSFQEYIRTDHMGDRKPRSTLGIRLILLYKLTVLRINTESQNYFNPFGEDDPPLKDGTVSHISTLKLYTFSG